MAKEQKVEQPKATSKAILSVLLEANKDKHLNFEEETYYRVSTGSLTLDSVIDGGLPPGIHRFCGFTEGGKTSASLEVCRNFLETVKNGKGILVKSEGRLSHEMQERTGLKFVYDAEKWEVGTVFVLETNNYEFVADTIRSLLDFSRKITGDKYCLIIDSLDALMRSDDIGKLATESTKVAGGTVILSDLLRRINLPFCKFGHLGLFISQVRSSIKIDMYSKEPAKLTSGSGGNAALHYANYIFDFEERYKGDLILEDEKSDVTIENPPIGHYAKLRILKSGNEKSRIKVTYPIKYGRKGGSVWVEKEVVEMLLSWEYLIKAGAGWMNASPELNKILVESGLPELPKLQGEKKVFEYLVSNPLSLNFLKDFLKKQISS